MPIQLPSNHIQYSIFSDPVITSTWHRNYWNTVELDHLMGQRIMASKFNTQLLHYEKLVSQLR